MALHTELAVDIHVYGEATKENCKFSLDFTDKVLDGLLAEASARVALAALASDIAFEFQSVVTGQLLLLKSDLEFTVKINGIGNPAYTVKPHTNSETAVVTPGFLALLGDDITELHFANPSSSEAIYVDVGVAGITT